MSNGVFRTKTKMENLPKAVGLIDLGGDARHQFLGAFVKLKRWMAAQPDRDPLKNHATSCKRIWWSNW